MSLGAGVIGGSCRRGCLPLRWPSEECSNAQNSMPHLTHPMIHILDEFLKAEDEHGFQNPRNLHNGVSSDKADEWCSTICRKQKLHHASYASRGEYRRAYAITSLTLRAFTLHSLYAGDPHHTSTSPLNCATMDSSSTLPIVHGPEDDSKTYVSSPSKLKHENYIYDKGSSCADLRLCGTISEYSQPDPVNAQYSFQPENLLLSGTSYKYGIGDHYGSNQPLPLNENGYDESHISTSSLELGETGYFDATDFLPRQWYWSLDSMLLICQHVFVLLEVNIPLLFIMLFPWRRTFLANLT